MIKLDAKQKSVRQTLEEVQRAADIKEKIQVLAQPHRRGDGGDMTDALGLFVRMHCTHTVEGREVCDRRIYDGGNEYFLLVYKWRRAKGIPNEEQLNEFSGSGAGELDEGTVDEWWKKIKRCENAMKCSGQPGFLAAQALTLRGIYPEASIVGPVKRAIHNLAMELGKFPY